jgi:hypothetical protein
MFSLLYWSWWCCLRWSHRVTVQKMNWYKKWKVSIREGLVCPRNLRCLRTKKLSEILHSDSWVMFVHIRHSCLVDPWDHVLPLSRFYEAEIMSPLSCWYTFGQMVWYSLCLSCLCAWEESGKLLTCVSSFVWDNEICWFMWKWGFSRISFVRELMWRLFVINLLEEIGLDCY